MSLPSYEGPLLSLTSRVDFSFLLSGLVGGLVHPAVPERVRAAADVTSAAALIREDA